MRIACSWQNVSEVMDVRNLEIETVENTLEEVEAMAGNNWKVAVVMVENNWKVAAAMVENNWKVPVVMAENN